MFAPTSFNLSRLLPLLLATVLAGCGGSDDFAPAPEEPVVVTPPSNPSDLLPAQFADVRRGAALFANVFKPGLLACADCHSDNPIVNNFGNIFAGRNASSLIQRAITNNTGGMGVFNGQLSENQVADIAAYLGNAPAPLDFGEVARGGVSPAKDVTISSGTKSGLSGLRLSVLGEFAKADTTCAAELVRFSQCTVGVVFKPQGAGARRGFVLIEHDGLPYPAVIALSGTGR